MKCIKCNIDKDQDGFYNHKKHSNICKECRLLYQRQWARNQYETNPAWRQDRINSANRYRLKNPNKVKEWSKHYSSREDVKLKHRFSYLKRQGADIEQAKTLEHINECQICNKYITGKYRNIDHDHNTGNIRGILCNNCNLGIGLFKDNQNLLKEAARYLSHNGEFTPEMNYFNLAD